MKPISFRICQVSEKYEALRDFYVGQLGFQPETQDHGIDGTIIDAGGSRLELWPEAEGMPAGEMIQIIVADIDAWAEQAKANGADLKGPFEVHGERMFALTAPDGRPVTVQMSAVPARSG